MPKISICIPTYNRANFIEKTISSVLNQTFKDFELIVRIDGSIDNTKEILDKIHDSRLKVLNNGKNVGYIETMHRLTDDSSCDWIQFLSDDDLLMPEYLENCVIAIDNVDNLGFVVTANNFIDSDGNYIYKVKKKYIKPEDYYKNIKDLIVFKPTEMLGNFTRMSIPLMNGKYKEILPTAFPSHIFNKKYLKYIGGSDPKLFYNHDSLVVADISCLAHCAYIDKSLVNYRIHANLSQAAGLSVEFVRQYFLFIDKFISFLNKENIKIENIRDNLLKSFEKNFFVWNGHLMRLASKGNSLIKKNNNIRKNLKLVYKYIPSAKNKYFFIKLLAYTLHPRIINVIGILYFKYVKR
jgi:glycosyltransferase involved in cell wall biosynthesis